MQQVEVKGEGALARRRDDTLGRIVVGRDDLQRFGDTNLADALKRQPGVSVSGADIRLRGLGAGYTQILIDGVPAPGGFAIDSLSPDLVERVEIQRSAQADASAQAVAGSINIILKKSGGPARPTLKIGAGRQAGATSPSATVQSSWQDGAAAYGLTATLVDTRRRERAVIDERTSTAGATAQRRFAQHGDDRLRRATIAPRADFKPGGGDTFSWQGLADLSRLASRAGELETTLQGPPTASPDARWHSLYDAWLAKSDLAWTHHMDAARLTVKVGLEAGNRDGDYHFRGIDSARIPWLHRAVDSRAFERRASTSGKFVMPLAAGHDFAIGWDGAMTRRGESRLQRDSDPGGAGSAPFYTLDQDYDATVGRMAGFAQDEWAIGPRLQAYLGLRWEGLDTRVDGRGFARATTMSRVWSPVGQLVWKLPGRERDQLRLSLARTYKAPPPRDLVPRRYTVNNGNGPASPDYQGNPSLRPELAWGIDAALESYPAQGAMLSVSGYARRIRDVTLLRLWEEDGVWVSAPANGAGARLHGVEFDGRLAFKQAGSPTAELRGNLARNWSRVDGVPGPDNRLASQAPYTANLGLDLRAPSGTSAGANLQLTGASRSRTAQWLTTTQGRQRNLEAYLAWQGAGGQWRLTVSDLLHATMRDGRIYDDGALASMRIAASARHTGVRLHYEAPL